jgi:glucose/arabinose dehydrogenase
LSFDGDRLVAADVGQSRWEEVNVVRSGANYGWNVREGRHCYDADDCPTETPDGDPLVDPVLEYSHDVGIAVVGGHVYRGSQVPALDGKYVFADWRQRLFVADPTGDAWEREDLAVAPGGAFDRFVLAFGRDHDGELYVATDGNSGPGGDSGRLSKFAPADAADTDPTGTASLTGSVTSTLTDPPTPPASDDDAGTGSDATPGFGALAAVAALAGATARRVSRD